jgi:hypothetical protein
MFEALLDQRIPGGCDDCDAYQQLTTDGSGIYVLAVRHDATCPWLSQRDRTTPPKEIRP